MQRYIVLNNNSLLKLLLLFIVFLIPLLSANNSFGYEQIKVLFFIFSITLAGFIWLLGRPKLKWSLINTASLVFILTLLIASFLGLDFRQSFLGNEPYFQGWLIYAYLGLFSVLVSSSQVSSKSYAYVLVLSAGLVAVAAIRQWVAVDFFNSPMPTYAGRVVSTFGQPNFYAGFLLLTLPFASKLGRWGNLFLVVGAGAILISGSRAAIFLLPLVFLVWIGEKIKWQRLKFSVITAVFLAVFGISLYLSFQSSTGIFWQEIFSPYQATLKAESQPKDSVEKRFFVWPLIWELVSRRPVAGYGLDNLDLSLSYYFSENKHALFEENLSPSSVLIRLKDLIIDRSHSYILDLLVFSGVIGLLGWLGLIGALFWKIKQNLNDRFNNVLLVSLVTYLVWIQFQNQSIVHLVYFWLLVGLIDKD